MNYKKILTILFFSACAINAKAQSQGFAAGANLLSNTGVSLKYAFNETMAFTGVVGFEINKFNNMFSMQLNLIKYADGTDFNIESGKLRPYFGGGVNIDLPEFGKAGFGLRAPVGIEYLIEGVPLEIYMDIAPTLDIDPSTAFKFKSSLGARYYF